MSHIASKSTAVIAALMVGASGVAFAYDSAPAAQASGSMAAGNVAQHCDSQQTGEHGTSAQDGVAQRPAMASHRWRVTPTDPFKDHGT